MSLGVYVLGALDADEEAAVRAHLEACAACRAEAEELSGLTPLLARVTERDIEQVGEPPRAVLDRLMITTAARRGRRRRLLLALAASVSVVALAGTAWLTVAQGARNGAAESAADTSTAQTADISAADRPEIALDRASTPGDGRTTMATEARGANGDMRVAVRLIPREGGTEVVARVAGVPAGTLCTLRAIGTDGTVAPVGSWSVAPGLYREDNVVFEGRTGLQLPYIQRLELTGSDGDVLVTVPVRHRPGPG